MQTLEQTAASWGLALSGAQIDQFQTYARELQDWNTRVNLTAITTTEGIVVRHFLDSLRCAQSWGTSPGSLIDIGTGAGFPGLPLKLLRPELRLTLVESIEKKAAFLRHMVALLGLHEVEVLPARAEALGRDPQWRERYDVAVGRAVADLRVLAEYCLPLCRVGGRFLAPKGGEVAAELDEAKAAIHALGGGDPLLEPVRLPETEPRSLVVVPKVAPTPPQYPRAIGVPARRPLS
ncbi:MAG TPA: 16S rRNA (guanine(527)-N(7))-methyltransferase RsmG [Roseiflexaceae bacterium]|nr:16S rRNA (guanine(527)-N(7))-methyltransferase RsmG [Roseiflexaceae bacterium]